MDPAKVLETTCELFLKSEIVLEDACNDMKEKIKNGEYTWVAKFFIYRLILEISLDEEIKITKIKILYLIYQNLKGIDKRLNEIANKLDSYKN